MPRSNDRAAEALTELAELVALAGGDPFRVRAYETAAREVAAYPRDLDGLDAKALDGIPSVGTHIAAKILQLLVQGHIDELDDLRAQVPAGLRGLLGVPGLGPTRARQLYEELDVASTEELLDALEHRRLRALHGWGPASEERLAAALRHDRETGGRMPLAGALDVAEELAAGLRSFPEAGEVAVAGSLRRMRATIGDVDLLVASIRPEAVMDAFGHLSLVAAVPERGPTKAVGTTRTGVHVDLRVVHPSVWGAALVYFTGSKAHSIHLRRIAQHAGLKLSEYGLERVTDGQVVASATEAQVYGALGLAFVPPTLREDRGEVEAAAEGTLPTLVELADLRGDLHAHTVLSDGLATLEEMVAAARSHHYRYFAVTDHAPLLAMTGMSTEEALAQRRAVRALEGEDGLVLLHGSELNVQPDGSLDWDDAFLDGFDVLVASVHSAFTMSADEMTARLVRAVEHPAVNVLGHPTTRILGHRPPVAFDAEAVFAAAARAGTALELNASPDRLDLDDEHARLAQSLGALLVISSDAHAVRHLDQVRYGVAMAQRGWVSPDHVVNTWPLRRLRRFLAKGRDR